MQQRQTPMMRQYLELKAKYADCVLFFRLGDFYEMFGDDAVEVSRLLNLTLTKRHEMPMCGVPFHAVTVYLGRLTKFGKKVAICEQLSDPKLPGIVQRDVVRVVTPGTTLDERILSAGRHNFVCACIRGEQGNFALALCDATTGLFNVEEVADENALTDCIARNRPAECIVDAAEKNVPSALKDFEKTPMYPHQLWEEPAKLLQKFFGIRSISTLGFAEGSAAATACAILISYLKETQKTDLAHIQPPRLNAHTEELILDRTACATLELTEMRSDGEFKGSLLSILDNTKSSMGARMLRGWLTAPSRNKKIIENRLDAVDELIENFSIHTQLSECLSHTLDVERLLGRLGLGSGNARDVLGIGMSLAFIESVISMLAPARSQQLLNIRHSLDSCRHLTALSQEICTALVEAPPLSVKEGGMMRDGYNSALDELKTISRWAKKIIAQIQAKEIERTGIQSLKIRYNQVFGYYLEVTKANLAKVPTDYIRKQTLVNAERFITPELKELEEKILGAEVRAMEIEYELFCALKEKVRAASRDIQGFAQCAAALDCLLSLATAAKRNRYVRPQLQDPGGVLEIRNGRHPVVESVSPQAFVPNDTVLDVTTRMHLITGPNMGGKSTYLRQTALIVLMAHMGSFVPAEKALIPLLDRIFTRVGAQDNLVGGQSTFMVEMEETAHILHYATEHSLVILDEIGRGTSTYDGVSLAWAILEFLHNETHAKTLFATHYHELIAVADSLQHCANLSVAVSEKDGKVAFLYRVISGAVNRSYGIEVARLAGLPIGVIQKARGILQDLEEGTVEAAISEKAKKDIRSENQMDIFSPRPHRVIEDLKKVDINSITPLEALQKLQALKIHAEN